MKPSSTPIWKKSMLQHLNLCDIRDALWEIGENGDAYGYDREESGYYQEYKEQFDELSAGAQSLLEALDAWDVSDNWDDMTVALLGETQKVLGYDAPEMDYYGMLAHEEEWAVYEAGKRIERLSKRDMIQVFRRLLAVIVSYSDLKAAHDCMTAIVLELDERGAALERKNDEINRLYEDLTGANAAKFDQIIATVPQRMWLE